ncbi:hypothetical protein HK100_004673 [Physocladia obscura]|uniref:Histone deacetylase domain-containing protein n=1 Tax=Physocladia obscura TaxID=109957 RepID=A0AAD5XCF4_9FUNG|nr:hypothetical protein HK100_004673 [Physocladia obscura]
MKVIYSASHAHHNPPKEIELGRFVDFKESPARVEAIVAALELLAFPLLPPVDHGIEVIERVHTKEYIDYFKTAYSKANNPKLCFNIKIKWIQRGGNPDGVFPDAFAVRAFANSSWKNNYHDSEFPKDGGLMGQPGYFCFDLTGIIAEGTFVAAYDAVQVALTAADILVDESCSAVFALCRPPGHHAHEDLCGGYCFFNNAAITVRYLLEKKLSLTDNNRIAILDIDYHHGNGTQEIFYSTSNPLYVSIHGYPNYPMFWGSTSETGIGAGNGYNVNIPLPIDTDDETYLNALKAVVESKIAKFEPDFLVVSLGVDTYVDDKVGNFLLSSACYLKIGQIIATVGKPTLFVMEGGYDIPALGINVTNVLWGFEEAYSSNVEKK